MKKIEFHGSQPSAFMEYRDGRTIVYDEDGDETFRLPGEVSEELLRAIFLIQRGAFKRGQMAGRAALQGEFCALMGLKKEES